MRPLISNKERANEAQQFHKAVFAKYGGHKRLCCFCSKPGAVDSAHVLPRAILGPLRYADPRLGRPAHRECHEAQHRGEIAFSFADRLDAVRAHNLIAKIPLQEPTE